MNVEITEEVCKVPESTVEDPPQKQTDISISVAYLKEQEKLLLDLITLKKNSDLEISQIESTIFSQESIYLEESLYGNVVRGFEGYASTRLVRKQRPREHDRIFSQSSVVYQKLVEMNRFKAEIYESQSDEEGYKPIKKRTRL
jgi:hypothetical protein